MKPDELMRQTCLEHLLAQSHKLPFARLSHEQAQCVADAADYQQWPDGSVLSDFGDPLASAPCFLLLDGHVAVHIALPDGREPLVANVETPGSVFGTDALYLPTERYARYVADGDVACALFTVTRIDALARQHPELAYKLIAMLSAVVYRNFRVSVKRLALDAAMQLTEKEQFEGELKAAEYRARVALSQDTEAPLRP